MKKYFILCLLTCLYLSCTPRQPLNICYNNLGFWLGLWHGLIAPISFIISLFSNTIRVYAYPNAGRWYDFGFMLGIGGFASSSYISSSKRK